MPVGVVAGEVLTFLHVGHGVGSVYTLDIAFDRSNSVSSILPFRTRWNSSCLTTIS